MDLYVKEQEQYAGAKNTVVKLNNLKGKLSQKVSTITKDHKFYRKYGMPTCTQDIEEEFRLNRIEDAHPKGELKKGMKNLNKQLSLSKKESVSLLTFLGK